MHDRPERQLSPPDFQVLFEAAPGLFLVLEPDLVIVAASDAYLRATMTRRETIVGRHLFEVFPDNPSDPGATGVSNLRQSLERVLATHLPDTMAFQKYDIRRPEAEGGGFEERYWSPLNSPVLKPGGSLAFIIHRVEDVTEFVRLSRLEAERDRVADELQTRLADSDAELLSRAAETALANRELARVNNELRRSQDFLDSLVENIPDMIFVKDAVDFRYVRFNRAGEELIGWSRTELLGQTDYDLFPKEEADRYRQNDRDVLAGKRAVDIGEEPIETRQGLRTLHTKKIPILSEGGTPMYLLGISEDVTARKEATDAMEAARIALEAASAAKSAFLSRMSHELRTPLTAILGFSELLGFEDLTEPQRANLRHISAAGQHLLALINEVLDISRIESGMMSLSIEPVRVGELLEELVVLIGPQAAGRRIRLAIVGEHLETYVIADRQRLKQVLLNLLTNAVKYNRDGGSITLGCRSVGDRLRIGVTDSGYGLAPEQIERLFRPFERLGAEVGSIEGTGIGLALSKGLIEAMDGRIGVESELDIGSTFWVELTITHAPIAASAADDPELGPAVLDGPDQTVLYIEDNEANQRLVQQILARRPSITLLVASDGARGIELAHEERPGLILLDLHLPDMPGREVLRLLRTSPDTRYIPVLVVSADASVGQVERLTEAGAMGYLTKPLVVSQFLAKVDEVLARPAPA